jgi:hypothetical protein
VRRLLAISAVSRVHIGFYVGEEQFDAVLTDLMMPVTEEFPVKMPFRVSRKLGRS